MTSMIDYPTWLSCFNPLNQHVGQYRGCFGAYIVRFEENLKIQAMLGMNAKLKDYGCEAPVSSLSDNEYPT